MGGAPFERGHMSEQITMFWEPSASRQFQKAFASLGLRAGVEGLWIRGVCVVHCGE